MSAATCAPAPVKIDRSWQGVFRPLVDRVWRERCAAQEEDPTDKVAKELWYRDAVHAAIGGWSTKGANSAEQQILIAHFKKLLPAAPAVEPDPRHCFFQGYSQAQNKNSISLAKKAYAIERKRTSGNMPSIDAWTSAIISQTCTGEVVPGTHLGGTTQGYYDDVMVSFAVIANDAFWLNRLAQGAEIRMRWQIKRYLVDLSWLYQRECGWEYLVGIWKQSKALPVSMDDAPADTLRQILAMLDTHIRRVCEKRNIRPMELPTRHEIGYRNFVVSGSCPVSEDQEAVPF